jgi:hypothetical protein
MGVSTAILRPLVRAADRVEHRASGMIRVALTCRLCSPLRFRRSHAAVDRRLAGLGGSPGDVCGKPLVTFWAGASVIGVAAAIQSSSSSRNASVPWLALSLASARASI